jgi:hypothetical protein
MRTILESRVRQLVVDRISNGLRSCLSGESAVTRVELSGANIIGVINGMKLPLCVVMYNPS